ncbi:unnamed protein product [Rotaria sp. Silwood1]|nr:unnamed protein product [Rotaria sp. Silwood1]CAF1191373.1 unnamed protein product [Rotaria sp. Silwood1]CAF3483293.1 unnamed protein product [Rotaria sp. Silwood1]CAF4980076.1 unnamed protein product [Rotaria sp. Silwood1]
MPYTKNTYPITTFILQHLDDYSNIQHIYPIVIFTNYLIEKFNYQINRNDATEKKILYYLTKDKDKHRTNQLYNDFLHDWYSLNLKEIHHGNQIIKFEKTISKEKFAKSASISALLFNTSSNEIEESVFDRALRADVKAELQKTTFTDDECQRAIKQFSHDAFEKQTISPLLKNIDRWISMLKRLMIRILNTNIELDERLQVYLERTYLWSDPITDADLATFQIDNDILHRHTYVILYALE